MQKKTLQGDKIGTYTWWKCLLKESKMKVTHAFTKHFNWKHANEYSLPVNKCSAKTHSIKMCPLVRVQCHLSHSLWHITCDFQVSISLKWSKITNIVVNTSECRVSLDFYDISLSVELPTIHCNNYFYWWDFTEALQSIQCSIHNNTFLFCTCFFIISCPV